jgi:MFS family permease
MTAGSARRRRSLRGAVANPILRRLWVALTVSWFGDALYGVALAVFVYDATGSAAWVAAATVARMLPYLLLSPYAGVLADRLPKVRILVVSELAAVVFMAGLSVVAVVDGPVLLAILLAAATETAGTPRGPAILAMLPEVADEDGLPSANALISVSDNIAMVAGPAAAVAMLVTIGTEGAFAINTVTFLVSAVLLSRLRRKDTTSAGKAAEGDSTLQRLREGLATAFGSSAPRACLGFLVLAYTLFGVDSVLFVVLATERLNIGSAGLGYLFAALGLGGLLVLPLINRLSSSARLMRSLTVAAVVYCLPIATLALIDQVGFAVVLIVAHGAAFVVIDVVTVTALQRLVPAGALGRVFAINASILVVGLMLGASVVAPVIALLGVGGAMLLFGLLPPALALLAYPRLRGLDERTSSRRDELAPSLASLERVQILATAPRPALERLASGARLGEAAAGSVVVREGAVADAFYVVVDGRLAVTSTGDGASAPVALGELGPGDCFGEIGLVNGRPRTATVTARIDCTLYTIPGEDFLAAVNDSPAARPAVLELVATRLARSHPGPVRGGMRTPGPGEAPAPPEGRQDRP